MTDVPVRFPKVASPYRREEDSNSNYVVDPDGEFLGVKQKFSWVFERADEVQAIEKLDGTNCAVYINENGSPVEGATRMGDKSMQLVEPYARSANHHYITRAIQNSQRRGYLQYLKLESWHFGEVVGPKMQGNPHELDEHLFIPFEWLRDKCEYNSYGKYDTSPSAIRDWFKGEENGLFSLFASRMHGQDLDASRPESGTFCEGLIFVHPDFDGRIHPDDLTCGNNGRTVKELAKLRRDMHTGHAEGVWPVSDYGHN